MGRSYLGKHYRCAWEIGAPGKAYTKWAAEMAESLKAGVPWVMCKQDDAPGDVVSIFFHPFCLFKSFLALLTNDV